MSGVVTSVQYARRLGAGYGAFRQALACAAAMREGREVPENLRHPGIERLAGRIAPPSGRVGHGYYWTPERIEKFERGGAGELSEGGVPESGVPESGVPGGRAPGGRGVAGERALPRGVRPEVASLGEKEILRLSGEVGLTEREARVLGGRYGLGGRAVGTLAELAGELGLSVETVRKAQLSAESRLAEALAGRR